MLTAYSELFVEKLSEECGITLKFVDLHNPKEYNFLTDTINAEVSQADYLKIIRSTKRGIFSRLIKEKFTSFDGFTSFYSNNLLEWPDNLLEYDEIEAGILFEAFIECTLSKDWELYLLGDESLELIVSSNLDQSENTKLTEWLKENEKN